MLTFGFEMLCYLIFVILSAMGLAILLVDKGEEWPMTIITKPLRKIILFFYSDAEKVLDCTVCCSFWTSLLIELILFFIFGSSCFLWPLSGFATVGIVFIIMDFLNILDKKE